MAKREKTPLEKMSTQELVRKIQQDLRRKMEEIGFDSAEGSTEKPRKQTPK